MSDLHTNYRTMREFLQMFNDIAVDYLESKAGWDLTRRHHPEDLVAQLSPILETMGLALGYPISKRDSSNEV